MALPLYAWTFATRPREERLLKARAGGCICAFTVSLPDGEWDVEKA